MCTHLSRLLLQIDILLNRTLFSQYNICDLMVKKIVSQLPVKPGVMLTL